MKAIRIRLERGEDINFIALKEKTPVINIQKAFKLFPYGDNNTQP